MSNVLRRDSMRCKSTILKAVLLRFLLFASDAIPLAQFLKPSVKFSPGGLALIKSRPRLHTNELVTVPVYLLFTAPLSL